jgi:small-conductance mechanosensitive channel
MEILKTPVLGNPLETWVVALCVAVALYSVLTLTRRVIVKRLRRLNETIDLNWYRAVLALLASTRAFFLFAISVSTASELLTLPPRASKILTNTALLALMVQLCLWGSAAIRSWVDSDIRQSPGDGARTQSMRAIGFLATAVLYLVVLLWGLDNFGVNINTLVAGLGVGGIAVALAVQNILGDLFASLTIVLDKPFVYGDYIVVGEYKGTIEHVGLKTTRMRSQSGEQLVFPNADLLQSRIRNYKRMQERRVCFKFGVAYETPMEVLRSIPDQIRKTVESKPLTRFERAHLQNFGDSALEYEIVYWILDPEYAKYADTHQAVNLEILEAFKKRGIEFAYPTRTVHLKSQNPLSN